MATQLPNQFTQFILTDEELIAGSVFSHAQLMVLQNLRSEYALRKIQLKFDPANQQQFLQEEAEIHGWINCINFILSEHEDKSNVSLNETNVEKPKSNGDYQVFKD